MRLNLFRHPTKQMTLVQAVQHLSKKIDALFVTIFFFGSFFALVAWGMFEMLNEVLK